MNWVSWDPKDSNKQVCFAICTDYISSTYDFKPVAFVNLNEKT